MSDESRRHPAAYAFASFALGLVGARALIDPSSAALGTAVAALLLLALSRSRLVRPAMLALLVAAGLAVGARELAATAREIALLTSEGDDRFVRVTLPVEDDWTTLEDGRRRLTARSFRADLDEGGVLEVGRRIVVVTAADEVPELLDAAELEAEGFLRRTPRGSYRLTVKSGRLMAARGDARRSSPAWWNRRLARALRDAAGEWRVASLGAALVEALVLGRQAHLPDEILESYQRGGTYHLLVFSGLQIAMLAGALRWLARRAGLRRSADLLLLAVSFVAPAFVGSDPSVSRSAWMLGLLIFTRLWERPVSATDALFVSALVRLVACPWEIDDPGFALTYAATAGIVAGGRGLAAMAGRRRSGFLAGAGAELATFPLTLLWFNRIVPGGSIATLLSGPLLLAMLFVGAVACGIAIQAPDAAFVLLDAIGGANDLVVAVNRFVADDAGLSVVLPSPPGWLVGAAFAVAVLAIARGRLSLFPAAVAVPLAAAIALGVLRYDAGEGEIRLLDVGQGDSILLRSGKGAILVDAGGSSRDPSVGRRVLVPRLADAGVRRIEAIVLTHPHPDHCGAIPAALRDFEVGSVVVARRHVSSPCVRRLLDEALRLGVPVADAEAEGTLRAPGLELRPVDAATTFRRAPENNGSLVYAARVGGRSLLLTGDVEKEAETVLRYDHAGSLRADVLKVPHHGGASSSTPKFLDLVRPRVALVSCGRGNPFGHPSPSVIGELRARGALVLRTDIDGTVVLRVENGQLRIAREFDTPSARH